MFTTINASMQSKFTKTSPKIFSNRGGGGAPCAPVLDPRLIWNSDVHMKKCLSAYFNFLSKLILYELLLTIVFMCADQTEVRDSTNCTNCTNVFMCCILVDNVGKNNRGWLYTFWVGQLQLWFWLDYNSLFSNVIWWILKELSPAKRCLGKRYSHK